MNVYVESGFIMTLALRQDDHQAARQIVQLAQANQIILKIPAFSFSEPLATVQYRANNRNRLVEELRKETRELGRTQSHQVMARELDQYIIQMTRIVQLHLDAIEAVVLELSRTATLLQLDPTVLARAASYKQTADLRLQDAIVLASILLDREHHQAQDPALFISQDKDFQVPPVQDLLRLAGCRHIPDFTNAVRFIERPTGQTE